MKTTRAQGSGDTNDSIGKYLELLELPAAFSRRYGKLPNRIFIRKSYQRLYEIVSGNMLHTRDSVTLFTGVPGIGKSLFLAYFIFRFLGDNRFPDKHFALEFDLGVYDYFEPVVISEPSSSSASTAAGIMNMDFLHSMPGRSCPVDEIPVFCDQFRTEEPMQHAKWLFIFSSPNPLRYKERMKYKPSYKYTMPTWTESELKCVNPDADKWIERFNLFGGVPRHVFWNGNGENPKNLLTNALKTKGGTVADYYFRYNHGNVDPERSYLLTHINPPWSDTLNDWLYDEYFVTNFASDEIFKELLNLKANCRFSEATDIFNAGISTETYGGASAGYLFEKMCLWVHPLNGKTIQAVSLTHQYDTFNISFPDNAFLLEYHWRDSKLLPDHYYRPKTANLESGDAFCLVSLPTKEENGEAQYALIVVQFTVAENHPIKMNGLRTIVAAFSNFTGKIMKKVLVFVTPFDGKLNSLQPLHNLRNKKIKNICEEAKGFEQYVYKYEFPSARE